MLLKGNRRNEHVNPAYVYILGHLMCTSNRRIFNATFALVRICKTMAQLSIDKFYTFLRLIDNC